MSRLTKYLEKNRVLTARALLESWESGARYHGDANIMKQIASAK